MADQATITEGRGQPSFATDADWGMCFVGASSKNPVAAGQVTPAYSSPVAARADLGVGDAVDALMQAIAVTPGNPAPPPAAFYSTPATAPGSYSAINVTGVKGTATITAGSEPLITCQPWMQIIVGGAVGTSGMTAWASLDGGRTQTQVQLGTLTSYSFPAKDGFAGEAGFNFGPSGPITGDQSTTTSSLYGSAATLDGLTLILAVNGGAFQTLTLSKATSVASQSALLAAIGAQWPGLVATAATSTHYLVLTASGAGTILVGGGTANALLGLTQGAATLLAGDTFYASTTPPMFEADDLYSYDAGPPQAYSGAFAAIAKSSSLFGIIVITEPIVGTDWTAASPTSTSDVFATLKLGLDYGLSRGKRWSLICRFRDPLPAETIDNYILAYQAYEATHHDSRITLIRAGQGLVTDALTARQYLRSPLAPYCARLQSCYVVAGERGEKLAQNPGWVARGPLEGFTIKDSAGNTLSTAVDVAEYAGGDAQAGAATGGGVSCVWRHEEEWVGTYVSNELQVLYDVGETILTPMDRRVANALERRAVNVATGSIGGADVFDPASLTLDSEIQDGIAAKVAKAIKADLANEGQNLTDPTIVQIDPVVSVTGSTVTISGAVKPRLYGYTGPLNLTFTASR